jgi:hypothetical protein
MYHRWAALALVLALWCLAPESAAGQAVSSPEQQQPRGRKTGTLGQNYPNPVNPETNIPFSLACVDGEGGDYVVSVRIYNVLAQLVAIPLILGRDEPLDNIKLPCGDYVAYWDGKVRNGGRPAVAGTYIYELIVDGDRSARKMLVDK